MLVLLEKFSSTHVCSRRFSRHAEQKDGKEPSSKHDSGSSAKDKSKKVGLCFCNAALEVSALTPARFGVLCLPMNQ